MGERPKNPRPGSFAEAAGRLGGVEPLDRRTGPGIAPPHRKASPRDGNATGSDAPESNQAKDPRRDTTGREKRPSVSARQLRNLRSGKIRPQLTIDLHGFTRDEALPRLCAAVLRAYRAGDRCILVIHGKGYRSPGGEAVLKSALAEWIKEPPLVNQVAAISPAKPRDGGSGASYLLLGVPGHSASD